MSTAKTPEVPADFDPYAAYRTDTDLEKNGIVLEEPNLRIRIARAGGSNTKFQSVYEEVMRPLRRAIELKVLTDDAALRATAEIVARSIILSWETRTAPGTEDFIAKVFDPEKREFVSPTPTNLKKALIAAPELCSYIFNQAKDGMLFREEIEGDLGN